MKELFNPNILIKQPVLKVAINALAFQNKKTQSLEKFSFESVEKA